jgi:adenylate cyclase
VSPEEARELRHELRTPVNHLIGYAELLLEEDDASEADAQALEAVRSHARGVLELVPGLVGDGVASGNSVDQLLDQVEALEVLSAGLLATSTLPEVDLSRLAEATARLRGLVGRLADGSVLVEREAGVAASPAPGHLGTILVVDDDATNRDVLSRRLHKLGYGTEVARDGLEALERLSLPGIDLVLLDVMMPRLDGFAVLERHRIDPTIRHIPVIMISALDDMASIVRCIAAGAEDYLPKPFDPVLLKARVEACLEKKRLGDELRDLNQHLAARVDEKVREVERLNTLRRFVSPQLAEAIASGAADVLRSHRREITVLFCDLRGFTSFAETAEPEEVMTVLREFHYAVGPMIFEHHGTIAQFTGDGLLAFFNDPVPLEEPSWEAVQLAIRMRDRTHELSAQWRLRGHELTLGIGIALGFATCGEIGFEGRTEYTAIGTVVNLAARICGIAAGDQILVTNRVHSMVEDRVSASDLGDHDFKGLSRPVPLFDVTSFS